MKDIFIKTCRVLCKNPKEFNAEVHFVTADEIRALNNKWRGVDKPTDVLSFPMVDWNKLMPRNGIAFLHTPRNDLKDVFKLDFNPATGKIELGDIVICRECAGEYSDKFLYLHGLLHLFGFTHDTDRDEDAMNAVVKEVLDVE